MRISAAQSLVSHQSRQRLNHRRCFTPSRPLPIGELSLLQDTTVVGAHSTGYGADHATPSFGHAFMPSGRLDDGGARSFVSGLACGNRNPTSERATAHSAATLAYVRGEYTKSRG